MKRIIPLLIICFLLCACQNKHHEHVMKAFGYDDHLDTTSYPLFINDGKKIVFQLGHMTTDKGLKLYSDTIAHPPKGFHLDDSVKQLLSVHDH